MRGGFVAGLIASIAACSSFDGTPPSNADAGVVEAGGSSGTSGGDGGVDGGLASEKDAGADGGDPASYRAVVLADKPTYYLALDEAFNSASVGSEGTGALKPTPKDIVLGQPGARGTAARFDGSTSEVVLGTLDTSGTRAVTFEVWVWLDQALQVESCPITQAADDHRYLLEILPDQVVFSRQLAGSPAAAGSYGGLTPKAFHHLVGTYDGASTRLYIDGELRGFVPDARSLPTGLNAAKVTVGSLASNVLFFRGVIDEVAVYDHALAEAVVKAHFQAGTRP